MIWRKVEMVVLIGVLCMLHVKLTESQTLSICSNPNPGSSCRLTCSTPDVTLAIFFLKLPDTGSQEGGCTSTGTCASSNDRYTVTQNAAQSETYLDISGLTYADDDSQWVCDYGATRSPAQTLIVPSIPAVVQFSPHPPTADLSQTLVMEAYCVYPVASLSPKLVYQDGQTNHTLDMTLYPVTEINGTNGCGAHEYTVTASFQLTPTTFSGISVRFWVQVTIAGQMIGSSLTTMTFHFPGPTSKTTPTTTTTTPTSTTTPTTTTTSPTTTTTTPTTTTPPTTTTTQTTTITTTPAITTTPTTNTRPITSSGFTDSELGAIIGGTVGGVSLLCLVGLAVFCYRVQSKESSKRDQKRRDWWDSRDTNKKPRRGDNPKGHIENENVFSSPGPKD